MNWLENKIAIIAAISRVLKVFVRDYGRMRSDEDKNEEIRVFLPQNEQEVIYHRDKNMAIIQDFLIRRII